MCAFTDNDEYEDLRERSPIELGPDDNIEQLGPVWQHPEIPDGRRARKGWFFIQLYPPGGVVGSFAMSPDGNTTIDLAETL